MRISIRTTGDAIGETIHDLEAVPSTITAKGGAIVHRNGEALNRVTRAISRQKAGPHGKNFANRISAEMITPLSVEVGPSPLVGTRYVGVNDPVGPRQDLEEALAKVLPKFIDDADDLMDGLL